MPTRSKFYFCLCFILLIACTNEQATDAPTLFETIPSEETGILFHNKVENSEQLNIFTYRNFYNGGGVAIGDINNDGLKDIYFTANMGSNQLYLNKGDWEFEDITQSAGIGAEDKWSTGVVMVDINHDGFLDIYVCNAGYLQGQKPSNLLYINNKDNTFTESATTYGLDDDGYTTHAAFFDYDKDGDLDAYILNNSFIPTNTLNYSNKRDVPYNDWPVKDFLKGGGDKFLENQNGKFVDVSEKTGIYQSLIGFGLGVTVGDINQDGYEDIYVSNDFFEKDYLYINQKDGTFSEELEQYFEHISHSSMGADLRDINNDGLPDLFVTDMLPDDDYRLKTMTSFDNINLRTLKESKGFYHQYMHNTLQLNSKGKFKDISFQAGVAASDWSWGALIFDADNDRYNDIMVCNGIFHDVTNLDFMDFFANDLMQQMVLKGEKEDLNKVIDKMPSIPVPNKIFSNQNGIDFKDLSELWGLHQNTFSNGAAYGDLDNDGDWDLVINNVNQDAIIYKNNTDNSSIRIQLEGKGKNPKAIGAKVYAYLNNEVQYQEINPSRGFQSSVDYDIIFGNPTAQAYDSIIVHWNHIESTLVKGPIMDSILIIQHGNQTIPLTSESQSSDTPMFKIDSSDFSKHDEKRYIDFYDDRGTFRKLSKEGPKSAIGDINNDGLNDIIICGATEQPSKLYLAQPDGSFKYSKQIGIEKHLKFEDTAIAIFDANNDGNPDIMIGSGGNQFEKNHAYLKDRLYLNDGSGNFNIDTNFKPQYATNTSVILPMDPDGDKDMDIIVFSRNVSQNYGMKPKHAFYENDGKGNFKNASEKFKGLQQIGMVCDAVSTNVLGNNQNELIVVGEWTSPKVFVWQDNQFQEEKTTLNEYSGLFYAIHHADLDGDGDVDLILGNHGTNNYLKSDASQALNLWIGDFDGNKSMDKVLTKRLSNGDVPIMLKNEMANQVISIKKQGIKHDDYARKTIHDLFPETDFNQILKLECNFLQHAIAWNNGNGQFDVEALPLTSQLSNIEAITTWDANDDGLLDIFYGGNEYDLLPQFSRMDASFGGLLLNQGERKFEFIHESESGISIEGEIKQIIPVRQKEKTGLLVFINDQKPVFINKNQ